jgi:hypothetical protein
MPIPMPYAQVQVQPVAQLMDPAFDQIRRAQASLLTKPVLLPLLFLSLALDLDVDVTFDATCRLGLIFTHCTYLAGVSGGTEGDTSSKPGALWSSHRGRLQTKCLPN